MDLFSIDRHSLINGGIMYSLELSDNAPFYLPKKNIYDGRYSRPQQKVIGFNIESLKLVSIFDNTEQYIECKVDHPNNTYYTGNYILGDSYQTIFNKIIHEINMDKTNNKLVNYINFIHSKYPEYLV